MSTGTQSSPSGEPSSVTPDKSIPERVLFGRSEEMQAVRARIERVAHTTIPILIVGESGTGKEVVARHIHLMSPWAGGPFLRVNCPAIPGSLLESEFFGYEQGAFTGASASKAGLVESANDGTVFLDGIGELEFSLQSKLLQLLQDGHFTRIGGQVTLRANVRFICAASRPLEEAIEAGTFRRDLYYRINVLTVRLPPLRERREDIPELIDYFLESFAEEFECRPRPISRNVLELLSRSEWPGNIRQLQNVMKRYVLLESEEAILTEVCSKAVTSAVRTADGKSVHLKQLTREAMRDLERKVILETLSNNHWNRRTTARALHISYRALLYKMKQGGLPSKRPGFGGSSVEGGQ